MANSHDYDVEAVASNFRFDETFDHFQPYGTGHINDTFLVTCYVEYRKQHYLLQRINHFVFKQPDAVQHNVRLVSDALYEDYKDVKDGDRRFITLIKTKDGKDFYKDADGNFWRMYDFAEHVTGYDVVENVSQAYQASKAFGSFLSALAKIPSDEIKVTIPDFHYTPKRLEACIEAIEADKCGRAASCQAQIDFVMAHKDMAGYLVDLHERGEIPMRVTHNDCKLNNVLLDSETHEAIRIIDLDTIMPGLAHYDFGDLVRTSTSPAKEDEPDTEKIYMRMEIFEALLRGYLSATKETLNEREVKELPFAGKLITFEIGLRFLTDYLSGDEYFKTKYEDHNLVRCKSQFKLVQSMIDQWDKMNDLVEKIIQEG